MDLGKGSFDFYLWHKLQDCYRRHWTIWSKCKLREIGVLLNKVNWNLTIFLLHPSVFNRKSNLHTNIFINNKKTAANSIWQILTTDRFRATPHWDESLIKDTHLPLLLCHMSHAKPKTKGKRKGQEGGRAQEHRVDRQKRKNRENTIKWKWHLLVVLAWPLLGN